MRREFVRGWLAKAGEGVCAAEASLAVELPVHGTASLHAEQAVEKALEAVLVRHQVAFDRTHGLARLLDLAEPVAPGIRAALGGATELTRFAAAIRSPVAPAEPSREEAAGHLHQQESLLEPKIEDWRWLVDSIQIDADHDGSVFRIALSDVPERKTDLVAGRYELPAAQCGRRLAVKLTDMLGEEVVVVRELGATA